METPKVEETEFSTIKEGKAEILFSKGNEVFYNPVQEVNRDLSIAVIKLFQEQWKKEQEEKKPSKRKGAETSAQVTILEALSATGLRSIRYAREIPDVRVTANDMDAAAVTAIQRNVRHNRCEAQVSVSHSDAVVKMAAAAESFTVVDLDPYGTAAPFLPGALTAVRDGGLLCVTCTDLAVLCGNRGEAAWSNYGSWALHAPYCHEQALRIVLASMASHAARSKRYIVPVLSLQIDFYVRLFVRVFTSPEKTKRTSTKLSQLLQCTGCDSYWLQPLSKELPTKNGNFKYLPPTLVLESNRCDTCGKSIKMGGPIWTDPLHDPVWIERLLSHVEEDPQLYGQHKKLAGLLHAAKDELHTQPLFYTLDSLCRTLRLTMPNMLSVRSALKHAGYDSSNSHCNPNAVKTNAPNSVVWDVLRSWHKLHPAKPHSDTSPSSIILGKPASFEANFTTHPDAVVKRVAKFIPNPDNWGPGTRAGKKRSAPKEPKQKSKKAKEEPQEKEPQEE